MAGERGDEAVFVTPNIRLLSMAFSSVFMLIAASTIVVSYFDGSLGLDDVVFGPIMLIGPILFVVYIYRSSAIIVRPASVVLFRYRRYELSLAEVESVEIVTAQLIAQRRAMLQFTLRDGSSFTYEHLNGPPEIGSTGRSIIDCARSLIMDNIDLLDMPSCGENASYEGARPQETAE